MKFTLPMLQTTARLAIQASVAALIIARSGSAQTVTDTTSAIAAGQSFGATMLPTTQANPTAATANPSSALSTNAPTASPLYTTAQPGAAGFSSGIGLMSQGSSAITACKNYVPTGNAVADQECAGVNFLVNNPTTTQFNIQANDPALTAFATAAASATNTESPGQQCVVSPVTIPAVFVNDSCTQTSILDPISCNRIYVPNCVPVPVQMAAYSATGSGALTASIAPTGTPGIYAFSVATPDGGNQGGDGFALISFSAATYNQSFFISINMGQIDDAGAVAVNSVPIWAGYPNNGPQYTALGNSPSYVPNYSWTEASGTYTADTKLMDSCPSGYAPVNISPGSGANTDAYLFGFFCNSLGQFMLNRHEGMYMSPSTLNTTVAMQPGTNTIQVFWGTQPGGNGEIHVTGTVNMISAGCTTNSPWQDGCAVMRTAL